MMHAIVTTASSSQERGLTIGSGGLEITDASRREWNVWIWLREREEQPERTQSSVCGCRQAQLFEGLRIAPEFPLE